jgi:tetratricopeptide (TPR) repeat protein
MWRRWLGVAVIAWGSMALAAGAPATQKDDAAIGRLMVQLESVSPAEREIADMRLRNLPASMAGEVERQYAMFKDGLGPESRARVEACIGTLHALAQAWQRKDADLQARKKLLLGLYERYGIRDPRWDPIAREVIELAVDESQRDQCRVRLLELGERLRQLGCTDPLALYFVAEAYATRPELSWQDASMALREAGYKLDNRKYPGFIRCLIAPRQAAIADALMEDRIGVKIPGSEWSMALGSCQSIKPTDGVPLSMLLESMAKPYIKKFEVLDAGMSDFKRLDGYFEKLALGSTELLLWRAAVYTARSTDEPRVAAGGMCGYASVAARQEGMLSKAKEYLDQAWKRDPGDVRTAMEWMTWALAKGDEKEAEHWYNESMRLDPDNLAACRQWMEHLPEEARLEFARKLAQSGNWRGKLPELLLEEREAESIDTPDKAAYWGQAEVWRDVDLALGRYVSAFPQDFHARSRLARYAMKCGRWTEAKRQFTALGEKPDLGIFGSVESFRYYRKKTLRMAAAIK